jgi:hypothetical protein
VQGLGGTASERITILYLILMVQGLGAVWPWDALTLVGILAVSWGSVRLLRRMLPQGAQLTARHV